MPGVQYTWNYQLIDIKKIMYIRAPTSNVHIPEGSCNAPYIPFTYYVFPSVWDVTFLLYS